MSPQFNSPLIKFGSRILKNQFYKPLSKCLSNSLSQSLSNQSGFIVADFLMAFVIVIGVGLFIFALTFSLATIEISQYIVWSSAHTYSMGNSDEATSKKEASLKFNTLSSQFPLLTGKGESSPWFILENFSAGDLSTNSFFSEFVKDTSDKLNRDGNTELRQPWTGVGATLFLKLFSNIKIPFLGKTNSEPDNLKFPLFGFIIRSPSSDECRQFFNKRFSEGIKKLDGFSTVGTTEINGLIVEDNGC